MKTTIKVAVPSVPNFLRCEGFPNTAIPIHEFSEKELKAIGREWTKKLIERSQTMMHSK